MIPARSEARLKRHSESTTSAVGATLPHVELPSGRVLPRQALKLTVVLLVLAACASITSVFLLRVDGYDGSFFLNWIREYSRMYDAGVYYPRWLPDSFAGLGSPAFYFYPPLAYFCAGTLHLVSSRMTGDGLFHSVGLLGSLLSFCASFLVLRTVQRLPIESRRLPVETKGLPVESQGSTLDTQRQCMGGANSSRKATLAAAAAALFYTFAPFRFFDLYTRNGLGEHLGFAFLPILLLGVFRSAVEDGWRTPTFLLIAFATTALLLSNIPLLLVSTITGGMLLLIMKRDWRQVARAGAGYIAGVALSASYLLPAIGLRQAIQQDKLWVLNGGHRSPDYVHALLRGGFNLTMGLHGVLCDALLLLLLAVSWRTWRRSGSPFAIAAFVVLAFIAMIQVPLVGDILFERVRIFELIQFVWRFYIVVIFLAAAWLARLSPSASSTDTLSIYAAVAALALATIGFVIISVGGFRVHAKPAHWTPYDPPEYAPAAATQDVNRLVRMVRDHAGEAAVIPARQLASNESLAWRETLQDMTLSVHFQEATAITFHRFDWPTWRLTANDHNVALLADSIGRISAILPAGSYSAQLTLGRSSYERTGNWISLLTAAIITLLLISRKWQRLGPRSFFAYFGHLRRGRVTEQSSVRVHHRRGSTDHG